jgi:hypothetical protein
MTLVELLVVVGLIIFIVTTFIFPAYERARGRATEVVCVSNLRQIGQALLMYAEDHDGFIPPYSNQEEVLSVMEERDGRDIRHIGARLTSYHGKRWRAVFDPYIRDKRIFFCPNDPFIGLPPEKTPFQGLPGTSKDFCYTRNIDHSISSYMVILQEWWFRRGYYPTTDIYHNMINYPRDWLFQPIGEGIPWFWLLGVQRLHNVAIYLKDYIHFIDPQNYFLADYEIELFYDGHVERHPCSIEKDLINYFQQYDKFGGEER